MRFWEIAETSSNNLYNAQGVKLFTLGKKELMKDVAVVIVEDEEKKLEEGAVSDEATEGTQQA